MSVTVNTSTLIAQVLKNVYQENIRESKPVELYVLAISVRNQLKDAYNIDVECKDILTDLYAYEDHIKGILFIL